MPYAMGQRVKFADATATVSSDEMVCAEGAINGEPITDDEGNVVFVPVFAARDNGRESTTIFVAVANILEAR